MARIAVLAALALLSAPTSPAFGAVTIGSDLARTPGEQATCVESSCVFVQTTLPGNAFALRAPSPGVIVRWRLKSAGGPAALVGLRVMRPLEPPSWSALGGRSVTTSGLGGTETFKLSPGLPVAAGDAIGLVQRSFAPIAGPLQDAEGLWWDPAPSSDTPAEPDFADTGTEVFFNADIEPDADGDGYGDETQDGCPADASTQGPCPVDLAVAMSASRAAAVSGEPVTVTVTVANRGSHSAQAVRLSWYVMGLGTLVTPAPGSCAPGLNSPATCDLGNLGSNGSLSYSATVTEPFATGPPTLPNLTETRRVLATIFTSQPDVTANDHQAAVEWTVTRLRSDAVAPVLKLGVPRQRLGTVLKKRLRVSVGASEAATGMVGLVLREGRRLTRASASVRWSVAAAGAATEVGLRPTATVARRLRKARKASFEIWASGQDAAGNPSAQVRRRIVLRRR